MSDKVHTVAIMAAILQATPIGKAMNDQPQFRTVQQTVDFAATLYEAVSAKVQP